MTTQQIDWSQVWYPGPKRAFTSDEMARAGGDGPSRTLVVIAGINFAAVALVVLQLAPASQTARLSAALIALAVMASTAARWLWWRPWRRPLMQVSMGLLAAMLALSLGIRWRVPDPADRYAVLLTLTVGIAALVVALWFLVMWRAQQIESRLREQAEREGAIEMARRLAAAQLEPHFLFNTLASVQHWVQTKDDRAAPLLAALTGYLRATLPMFNRPLIPAGDELLAIERYLQVMQARLGAARLAWCIDVDAAVQALPLPPGLLLTLVENAVEHGIEPRLSAGELLLTGHRQGDEAVFVVQDNGPGPAAGMSPPGRPKGEYRRAQPVGCLMSEGAGLANVRQRLALTCGDGARLSITAAPGGGCRAEIRLPWREPS